MKIRRAVRTDVPAIHEIATACPTSAHWPEDEYVQALENIAARRTVLVAEDDERVLGFAVARSIDHEWELENVAVVPDRQKKGIGQALMHVLVDLAQRCGAEAIHLEVRESNSYARTLYERCGFQQLAVRKNYYSGPEENAVLYRYLCTPELLEKH
ncbi:MAG TPA: ribosomal protein S18-alanine N-acetyltransferase [Terriglobales bacterium]|nr:ribosomal protein S18-alanine N-acetyltransferase [Terriglobales bacterium]